MTAYYNEIDPFAAAWLRELIKAGEIAPGDVDERDIRDVMPGDLHGYTQCHFFAGIGVWSHALRRAGWSDDRPVWTGSCPCQPFSAAGKGGGFDDERHLWPAWHHLIRICRPPVVFGEQVASKDGLQWFDLVQADMEGEGYAIGAADMCAAGLGAPHIRQRLWFVAERLADADDDGSLDGVHPTDRWPAKSASKYGGPDGLADAECEQWERRRAGEARDQSGPFERVERLRDAGRMADTDDAGSQGRVVGGDSADQCTSRQAGMARGLADADSFGAQRKSGDAPEAARLSQAQRQPEHDADVFERGGADHDGRPALRGDGLPGGAPRPRTAHGGWAVADWLFCRDGKWRPVEPGTFPLVDGAPARVGRLRGYGNAIVAPVAQAFIEAAEEARADARRLRLTGLSAITTDEDVFS